MEQEPIFLRRKLRLKLPDAIVAATARHHALTFLTPDEKLSLALAKL